MIDTLKPCPKCGCEGIGQVCHIGIHASWCYCFCGECGFDGPCAPSEEQACAAWNEREEEAK